MSKSKNNYPPEKRNLFHSEDYSDFQTESDDYEKQQSVDRVLVDVGKSLEASLCEHGFMLMASGKRLMRKVGQFQHYIVLKGSLDNRAGHYVGGYLEIEVKSNNFKKWLLTRHYPYPDDFIFLCDLAQLIPEVNDLNYDFTNAVERRENIINAVDKIEHYALAIFNIFTDQGTLRDVLQKHSLGSFVPHWMALLLADWVGGHKLVQRQLDIFYSLSPTYRYRLQEKVRNLRERGPEKTYSGPIGDLARVIVELDLDENSFSSV